MVSRIVCLEEHDAPQTSSNFPSESQPYLNQLITNTKGSSINTKEYITDDKLANLFKVDLFRIVVLFRISHRSSDKNLSGLVPKISLRKNGHIVSVKIFNEPELDPVLRNY